MSLPAPIDVEVDTGQPGETPASVRYTATCKACSCRFTFGLGNGTFTAEVSGTGFTIPCPNCTLPVFRHL